MNVLPDGHPGWAVKRHTPVVGWQHAPRCGHGFGEHTVPTPWNVRSALPKPVVQLLWVSCVQEPKTLWQHAPVGGHGEGTHVEPPPWKACPPPEHCDCTVVVHVPKVVLQQAPGWGQELGSQRPKGAKVLPVPHPARVVSKQAPVLCEQQAPGQGVGVQDVPMPRKVPEHWA